MRDNSQIGSSSALKRTNKQSFTHVECDSDDVEAHRGVGDAAEGRRLQGKKTETDVKDMSRMLFFHRRGEVEALKGAHPVDFGQFVPPSAPLVSTHQL